MEIKSFFCKSKKFAIILFSFIFFNIFSQTVIPSPEEIKDSNINFLQKNFYLLGPGDVINLNIIDVPELSTAIEVLPDGTIFLPLAGSVVVEDLSIDDAKKLIQEKLSDHLLVPEVQLSILKLKPIRVTMIGEFQKPGIYLFDKNSSLNNAKITTLVDAIKNAGGLTNRSNIREIKIVRKHLKDNRLEFKEATFNLWELIKKGDQDNNPVLFDGDSIFIEPVKVTSNETNEFAFANLTPDNIEVTIIGSVKSPGKITLPINTPISQAVYSAGGPQEFQSQNKAYLIRQNRNGSVTNKRYKLNTKLSISDKFNPPLRNNDIVYVPPNNLSRATGALGTVASPLTNLVTILSFLKLVETY